jgi:transcriptional regulator with PAS, ATPase and Fis domain
VDPALIGKTVLASPAARAQTLPIPSGARSIVLGNARVRQAYELARRAARTEVPVLVLGETGTGKEHLAWTIHAMSARAGGPFKTINCAAVPDSLVESALFGHERGAFTGADRRVAGVFEAAREGVVLMDEIAELSQKAQAALLRALETKKICRVGSATEVDLDVRIVAVTHRDLARMVDEGTFREDLLYRLNTVTVELPPLRERTDDLEALVAAFLAQAREAWGLPVHGVDVEAMDILGRYPWPGNIRQLRNTVERAALASTTTVITRGDLPGPILEWRQAAILSVNGDGKEAGLEEKLRDFEAELLSATLRRTGGNRSAAAAELKVSLRTLYRRLKELGLKDA